jgi:outer membrane protein insertion porin family
VQAKVIRRGGWLRLTGCVLLYLVTPALLLLTASNAVAQYAPIALSTYEGQNATAVVLAGRPDLDTAKFSSRLAQRPGEPFSEKKINESIAALKATGQFTDVELQVRPEANGVRVLFILQPAVYIGVYRFPGATAVFPYSRLLQVANYQSQMPYTPDEIPQAQTALTDFFHRSGFFLAQVKPDVQTDAEHGVANVVFHTTLGKRAKFGNIIIEGTSPEQTARLKGDVRSIRAVLTASSLKPGKNYVLPRVERATRYMQSRLGKQGYLAAQVRFIAAEYDPETNRADLRFTVQTGPVVHVKVNGTHLWPWNRSKLIPIYSENSIDPDLIQEGERNLISYLQSKGFFDVAVHTEVQQHSDPTTIVYQVTKGKRHKVDSVSVTGNQHYSDKDLLGHVPVKKAGFWPFSNGKFSQRLLRTSVRNLEAVYKASGFSEVHVEPDISEEKNGDLAVSFRVQEGPQDVVEALNIVGNNTVPDAQLTTSGLRLGPGKPYSESLLHEDRNQIVANYLRRGYLTATFTAKAEPVKGKPHHVNVTYQIYEGPQVFTSAVLTEGREHTQQSLVDRAVQIHAGTPLTEDGMLSAESRLYELDIFDWAAVDPRRPVTTQQKDEALVKIHEAKRNTIGYSFGFQVINRGGSVPSGTVAVPGLPPIGLPKGFKTSEKTFYGPTGSFDYTRKNLRGRAESFSVGVFAGRLNQKGSATYTIPAFRNSAWQVSTSITGEHDSENPIFTSRLSDTALQFQRYLNAKKTKTLFLRYDFRESSVTHLLIPELVPPSDQHLRLSQLSSSFQHDTRDNPLDAHKGIYNSYQVVLNPKALGSNFSFARFTGQTAYYWPIPAGIVWANSIRIGVEASFGDSHVPVPERFFSGGGSTLRGFPLNGAGPQETIPACGNPSDPSTCSLIQVPTGGNQLFIVNSEFRIPLPIKKGLGMAGFYDGGNVFTHVGFHGQYTNTFGGGLRYATPIGPIRIDVGHNLNAPPGIKSTQIFATIGQAF